MYIWVFFWKFCQMFQTISSSFFIIPRSDLNSFSVPCDQGSIGLTNTNVVLFNRQEIMALVILVFTTILFSAPWHPTSSFKNWCLCNPNDRNSLNLKTLNYGRSCNLICKHTGSLNHIVRQVLTEITSNICRMMKNTPCAQ